MVYHCTGCDAKPVAEYKHDLLNVALCGNCHHLVKHADFSHQHQYCTWCGEGDDESRKLYVCDTCPHAFCTQCIERNFSIREAVRVRDALPWSCYLCDPVAEFISKQLPENHVFLNMELAYEKCSSYSRSATLSTECCFEGLTTKEQFLIMLLFPPGSIPTAASMPYSATWNHSDTHNVLSFFHARDIAKLHVISKNLRGYLNSVVFCPVSPLRMLDPSMN